MSHQAPKRECYGCGGYYDDSQLEGIDVSRDDEYYPRFIYVCSGCQRNPPGAGGGVDE